MNGITIPCSCGGTMTIIRSQWGSSLSPNLYVCCEFACGRCGVHCLQDVALQLLQQAGALTPPPPETPKPDPAPEPERVIDGSVIGYRAWRIVDWALTGTGVNRAWAPGVNEATCDTGTGSQMMYFSTGARPQRHLAPYVGCHCGITALARFAEHDSHWSGADVYGAIEAWSDQDPDGEHGRFILHGTGFRAQYGKVVLLAVDDEWPLAKRGAVRALAAEHGADVCKRSHLEDAAKEHGQLVPDEMLEWAKEGDPETESLGLGGQFISPLWATSQFQAYSSTGYSINTVRSMFGLPGLSPPRRPSPNPTRKGICQTLGYPGPPANPTIKRSSGDRVRDSKGRIWQCVKGGKPGVWEAEESASGG